MQIRNSQVAEYSQRLERKQHAGSVAKSVRAHVCAYVDRASYGWSFVRAYALLARARRLIASGGLQGAELALLGSRERTRPRGRKPQRASVDRVERAIVDACRWQVKETNCFPRAIAAYVLLDAIGAEPTLLSECAPGRSRDMPGWRSMVLRWPIRSRSRRGRRCA